MGAGGSVPEVPASGLGVDVPTFKKLRKAYESKKDGEFMQCVCVVSSENGLL
jgi:hypothetical protein